MLLMPTAAQAPSTSTARATPLDGRRVEDRQFLAMQRAFAQTGGLANGDEVAQLMRRHSAQPLSTLARWIVDRRVVSYFWRGQTWLPLFQFALPGMQLRAEARTIVAELVDLCDDWELALWFVQPNEWLDDATPLERFDADPSGVLQAARIDRFIALG